MEAKQLDDIVLDEGMGFLNDGGYQHETLRALLEIRDSLNNISHHLRKLSDKHGYQDPCEGAI